MITKKAFSDYTVENIHPGFSIDCVVLCYHKGNIKVLLPKFHLADYWALPGGFMFNNEDAESAAYRILNEKTGLKDVFLKQFYLFSDPKRTVMEQNEEYVATHASTNIEGQWLLRRFVSLGYYALVKYDTVKLEKTSDQNFKWYNIHDLPKLYTDHRFIVNKVLEIIGTMLPISNIAYELLPEKFTMTELRNIHEIVLGKELDRRNFQRKILSEGNIIQLDETKESNAYNPPILYTFDVPKIGAKEFSEPHAIPLSER